MDFLTKAIAKALGNWLLGIVEKLIVGITGLFQSFANQFLQNGLIKGAQNTMLGISLGIIVLFCVKQYFDTYVMETNGDADSDPLDIVVRGAQASAFASCSSWIFMSFMNFTSAFASKLITGTNDEQDITGSLSSAINAFINQITVGGFIWLIFIAVIIIGLIAFVIIAAIRAVELSMMYVILPLFSTELTYSSHERFDGLLTNIVVTGLYFALQLLMFSLFISNTVLLLSGLTSNPDQGFGTQAFASLGFMIAMIRSPKWLEKFVYNSGLGDSVKRGAGMMGSGLSYSLTRKILK